MGWVLLETNKTQHSPPRPRLPPPAPPAHGGLDSNISPSILLIIVILSVIFFISGLLHLLVRLLLRPTSRDPEDPDNATALQGPLQQLFHLHDSGVDQSFIDALPVFLYRAIVGAKDPFDCAVCLCEFDVDDKLRLLPACSHAFHVECIDTWLLSHSTCPLCRSSLLPPEFSPAGGGCGPAVIVLESADESSREIVADGESLATAHVEEDITGDRPQKTGEVGPKEETGVTVAESSPEPPVKVVTVKLGKFRNVDVATAGAAAGGGEGTSNGGIVDDRRCFSMGSFEYVMNEASVLHVAIKPPARKPGRRLAMSECDCHSRREGFKGFEAPRSGAETGGATSGGGIGAGTRRKESFSVSKIWLRPSKKEKAAAEDGSRRASSFRLPMQRGAAAAEGASASWWERSGSEFSFDVEAGSCDGSEQAPAGETPSFARRTLLWVVGRHHKVGNHN